MKGASLFLMLVLLVLAVLPLTASTDQGNTGFNSLRTSPINSEEVPFSDQEQFDSNIAVLGVGLTKEHPINYIVIISGESAFPIKNNSTSQNVKYKNKNRYGGVHRIKSGRH